MAEDARLLGQSSYIYEAGACVVLDGEEHWLTGDLLPGELTIAEQIERSGAPALLLEHYAGRLEYHEPWHIEREVSHLFRGLVDAQEVDRVLAEHGHEDLRLVDNGVGQPPLAGARGLPHVRGYHLVPAGASKAGAVAFHRRARGYAREETFAVGDSREDLACAAARGDVLAGRQRARSATPRSARRCGPRERARVRGGARRGRLRGGREHADGSSSEGSGPLSAEFAGRAHGRGTCRCPACRGEVCLRRR